MQASFSNRDSKLILYCYVLIFDMYLTAIYLVLQY